MHSFDDCRVAGGPLVALFDLAHAVEELLARTERRLVDFRLTVDQFETRAELSMERIGIVANHIEAAAFLGPFGTECGHDHVAAGFDGPCDLADVRNTIFRLGQEVEERRGHATCRSDSLAMLFA